MARIHKLADVHPEAQLAEDVEVGAFTVIEAGAKIEKGTKIGPHALITGHARIGEDVKIHNGAVVGTDPQDLKFEGEDTYLEVGDRTVVREFVTLNRGTNHSGKTVVGADCFIMAYAHVAHDCRIGNNVILANSVNLAGHIEIEDFVIVGGMVPMHQFVRIGKHAMISGGRRVKGDIPPYIIAGGDPLIYRGLNTVGLRRRGFSAEDRSKLKAIYKIVFKSELNLSQAVERLRDEMEYEGYVKEIVEFIESRGKRSFLRS